jgi:hypothetical protein
MKRRLTEITILILGIFIGALTNVATGELPNMLPPAWKDYLWLSWVPLGISILAVVILEWRASRDDAAQPPLPSGDSFQGDKLGGDVVGGDNVLGGKVGGDSISIGDISNSAAVAIGAGATANIYQMPPLTPVLHQLRAPVADFIGREREIDKLVQALGAATGAAAAISGVRGMGGIGKTELAYAVAQRLKGNFPASPSNSKAIWRGQQS